MVYLFPFSLTVTIILNNKYIYSNILTLHDEYRDRFNWVVYLLKCDVCS